MLRITMCGAVLVLASTGADYLDSPLARLAILVIAEVAALAVTAPLLYRLARAQIERELRGAWRASRPSERAKPE